MRVCQYFRAAGGAVWRRTVRRTRCRASGAGRRGGSVRRAYGKKMRGRWRLPEVRCCGRVRNRLCGSGGRRCVILIGMHNNPNTGHTAPSPGGGSGFAIREIIYGGVDGIITTFAVVSGFSGAAVSHESAVVLSTGLVLLFGLANLFADGVSMGLGGFLSMRSEKKLYDALEERERDVMRHDTERAVRDTEDFFVRRGFSRDDARTVTSLLRKNEPSWLSYRMREKIGLLPVDNTHARKKSLSVFLAFILFGIIPIIPFFFISSAVYAFYCSVAGFFISLTILGLVRCFITKERACRAVGEVLLIGAVAGGVAFLVGSLLKGVV